MISIALAPGPLASRSSRALARHTGIVTAGANLEAMRVIPGVDVDVDEGRLADICDRYGIAELQIFGSQARGTAGPTSDIDVLYTMRPGRRLGWEIEQLADELTGLFGRRVDLVSLRSLHPDAQGVSSGRGPARLCSVTFSCSPR